MYHTSPISSVSASEHGYVATAGYDNKVTLWDSKTHVPIAVGVHDHLANQVAFDHDGKFLASSSSDYSVRIWSLPGMVLQSVLNHQDDVEGICFNPTGNLIATASRDRKVRVFTTEGILVREFVGHENDALSVEWLSETEIISCGDDSTLRYWCLTTGQCLKVIDLGGMETDTLCVTRLGKIISGNDDGDIIYFDADGVEIVKIQAHRSGIKRLVLHENKVISLSYDRRFKIWLVGDGNLSLDAEGDLPNIVWPRSAAFIDDDNVAFVTFGDRYAVFQLSTQSWQTDAISDTHGINAIFPNAGGYYDVGDAGIVRFNGEVINQVPSLCNFVIEAKNYILCGGQDGAIYDAKTNKCVYQHHSPLNCAQSFMLAGQDIVVAGAYTGEVIFLIFIPEMGYQLLKVEKVHANAIKDIAYSGGRLFTVCADNTVKELQLNDHIELQEVFHGAHQKIVNGCAALTDGFVSISRDLTLRFWGESNLVIKTPHKNSIKCVATDGNQYVMSGDYRGVVSCYNRIENTWVSSKVSASGISAIEYDKEQDHFLASSYDGKIHKVYKQEQRVIA